MGGKNKKVTVGYHYHVAYHHGLSATPIDAFLEYRAADKTAWSGELTASGTIHIDAPNLFGGEKDQGGIVGDVDVMFGEPTQQPNAYLAATFGDQQPGWRGVTTLVFKGGRFGANNPYPQKPAYKIRAIKKGWDDDPGDGSKCWYPEKAAVAFISSFVQADAIQWRYLIASSADATHYESQSYADAGWTDGVAPFGKMKTSGTSPDYPQNHGFAAAIGTEVFIDQTHVLWVRGHVWLAQASAVGLLEAFIDNNADIFVNGLHVASVALPSGGYISQALTSVPLLAGDNLIAVRLEEADPPSTSNRTWLDFRLVGENGGQFGMNPSHILYDALTSRDRGAEPIANINDASFRTAADWFYSQGIGLCTRFDPDAETVEQFIQRIEKVAGCSVSRSPVDGEWYLDIANGVYTLADLPILTDDDILDFAESPSTLDDAVNSISVEYIDVEKKITATTPPVQALALVTINGVHHDVHQYHEAPTPDLAARLVQRDLQAAVTPTRAFDLTTSRKPFGWRVNTYFRLQSPKRAIADMVCLLAEKSSGTLKSGAMKVTATENIYSMPLSSFVSVEPGVDTRPSGTPVPINARGAMEMPYVVAAGQISAQTLADLDADAAFVMAFAADPGRQRDFTMQVSPHGAATYTTAGDGDWCGVAKIVEGDTLRGAVPATSFTLTAGSGLSQVQVGSAALWDNEIVRVDAIDAAGGTLTLGRGCGDAVAAPHAAASRIYFFGGDAAFDTTQFTAGESLDVRLLANTGSAQQDPTGAAVMTVPMVGRLALPYPPGLLRIAGSAYPTAVSGTFVVTWAHRNRVAQADQLVDASMASVTPADNTRYHLKFVDSGGALLVERLDIGPATASVVLNYTGNVTMTLETLDDAGSSLQQHTVTFAYTPPSPAPGASAITATAYTPVFDGIIYDGNGSDPT